MIRAILLSSALAALAPTAQAGDFSLIFGLGDRHGNSVRVRVGDRSDRRSDHRRHRSHDRRVDRHRRHDHDVRVSHRRGHRHHGSNVHRPRYRTVTEHVWVAGHYDRVAYQVRVAGVSRRVRVAARYEWRTDRCGVRYRVLVQRSHYKNVRQPDRYETRYKRVFHPGRYETRTRKIRI